MTTVISLTWWCTRSGIQLGSGTSRVGPIVTAISVLYGRMCYQVRLCDSYISVMWENVLPGKFVWQLHQCYMGERVTRACYHVRLCDSCVIWETRMWEKNYVPIYVWIELNEKCVANFVIAVTGWETNVANNPLNTTLEHSTAFRPSDWLYSGHGITVSTWWLVLWEIKTTVSRGGVYLYMQCFFLYPPIENKHSVVYCLPLKVHTAV